MPQVPGPGLPPGGLPGVKPYRPHPIGGGLLAKKCCCAPVGGGCPIWSVPPCHEHMRIIHTQFIVMCPAADYPEFYCIHHIAFMIRAPFNPASHTYQGYNDSNLIVYFTDHVERYIDGELEGSFDLEYPHIQFHPNYGLDLRCDYHPGDPTPYNTVTYWARCDWMAMYCDKPFTGRWWQADPVAPGEQCVRTGQYTVFEPSPSPDINVLQPGNMIILDPA